MLGSPTFGNSHFELKSRVSGFSVRAEGVSVEQLNEGDGEQFSFWSCVYGRLGRFRLMV